MTFRVERRSGTDRRQKDIVMLGKTDRRKRVEARKSVVEEIELSEIEWEAYFGKHFKAALP